MGKIARSWELVKASWAVLQADKELIVFPILSTIAVCLVMVSFAVPMFLAGMFEAGFAPAGGLPILGTFLGFVFYVLQYTIIFYCNSALVGAAMIRLKGGDPTLRDGLERGRAAAAERVEDDVTRPRIPVDESVRERCRKAREV